MTPVSTPRVEGRWHCPTCPGCRCLIGQSRPAEMGPAPAKKFIVNEAKAWWHSVCLGILRGLEGRT